MASPEHGRSSSSPNVRIESLRYEGADGSVLRVRLDDGSLFLLDDDHPLAPAVLAARDSGELLDPGLLEAMETADETYRCRRKAVDLLTRAEQCRRGLQVKLARKNYSRESVTAALDRLEAAGMLDDRRFAEAWARSRIRARPEGPGKVRSALMNRGVSGTVAAEAVDAVFREAGEDSVDQALERAWVKLSRHSGMSEEKLTSALVRRGFRINRVREFLREREAES